MNYSSVKTSKSAQERRCFISQSEKHLGGKKPPQLKAKQAKKKHWDKDVPAV